VRGRGSGSWLGKQIGMNRCKFGTVSKVLAIRLVDTCIYSTSIYICVSFIIRFQTYVTFVVRAGLMWLTNYIGWEVAVLVLG
jgi:hypothetical protein